MTDLLLWTVIILFYLAFIPFQPRSCPKSNKASIAAKKQEFDDYRAKLKTQFEDKEAEVQSSVDEWKASREVQKLQHRAEKAEDYAATSVYLALAMME